MEQNMLFYPYEFEAISEAQKRLDNMLLYYHGPFNNKIILHLGQDLRQRLAHNQDLSWKVFSIFVELSQNIYFNALEHNITNTEEPVGIVFIEEHEDGLSITSANIASVEALQRIQEKCDHINQLDTTQLHAYKKELLRKSENDLSYRGGNIGLVQVALLAQNKINIQIKDSHQTTTFFSLTTTLNK